MLDRIFAFFLLVVYSFCTLILLLFGFAAGNKFHGALQTIEELFHLLGLGSGDDEQEDDHNRINVS